MNIQAPIKIEMHVSITNGEGTTGVATIGLGNGKYPTEQDMREALEKFTAENMPDGFRIMDKEEFFNSICMENLGVDGFAIPGGREYDA